VYVSRVVDYPALLADLAAEEADLDAVVSDLDGAQWTTSTPAVGWDVRDTVAHLAVSERLAATALEDPDAFGAQLAELLADLDATEAAMLAEGRARSGDAVLAWWRTERDRTIAGLRARAPADRIPWVTGPMSAVSFATARLMETWAHGHDVAEALQVVRGPTARLRHIAELGVRTRGFSYAVNGRDLPAGEVRVELVGLGGAEWTWGTSTTDVVSGDALDFCLVVTRRRRPADTNLVVTGPRAREWIAIAQAFAGPPAGSPRSRSSRSGS
jgi:uncharacterized protein (TIGR03084 family)